MGLVALQYVASFRTRDGTRVPCIGRQILNHWTTLTGCVTLEKDLDISVPLGKILLMASNGHQLDIPLAKKEFFLSYDFLKQWKKFRRVEKDWRGGRMRAWLSPEPLATGIFHVKVGPCRYRLSLSKSRLSCLLLKFSRERNWLAHLGSGMWFKLRVQRLSL